MSKALEPLKGEEFFLKGSEPANNISFLAPVRSGNLLEPIIDGVATFKSMEETIAAAKTSVFLAFWIFNPDTPLQSGSLRRSSLKTWSDLLGATAGRGVDIRLLLTGFDPLLGADLHRNNWKAYKRMVLEATRLVGKNKELLQTIVSLHPASVSVGISAILEKNLTDRIAFLNGLLAKKGKTVALDIFAVWPGLWNLVEFNPKLVKFSARSNISLQAFPAAHHQKLCIVDETIAYCGGLDINTGRIATPSHDSPKNFWHDLDVRIEGAAALDICRNFIGRWNVEAPSFESFVKEANKASPPIPMVLHMARPDLKLKTTKLPASGKALVQIHRTRSVNAFFDPVPNTVQDDIKKGYEKAIGLAQQFVYIENQYVRSPELGDWIINQAKKIPELQVIIVLPVAPEEVGKTGKGDEVTEHGLALQHELFSRLRKELKDRIGIYSPIMKVKGAKVSKTEVFGSPQIYVHSKLLLVDDHYANISSANANPRSFYVDTEIAAACFEPSEVQKLRLLLWQELLGGAAKIASWKPDDFIREWNKIATANERASINKRQGFIIRHDESKFKFTGTKSSTILDKFATVFDVETGKIDEEDMELV